jgi:L-seryl-tRNA(Ser) seleniumtransferase
MMGSLGTRRKFFGHIYKALAGCAFANALPFRVACAADRPPDEGEDYFDKLGVTKIINAAGTYTHLTASTMPPSVQAALRRLRNIPCTWLICRKRLANTLSGNYAAKRRWLLRAQLLP